jgi:hypothetical protein
MDDSTTYTITAAVNGSNKQETLEEFFISKFGTCVGKRTFKELVAFAKEKTKNIPGDTGVILTIKGGKIISITEQA